MAVQVRTELEKDGGYVSCAFDVENRWTASIGRADTELLSQSRAAEQLARSRRDGVVGASLLNTRTPTSDETYEAFLDWHGLLGGGFIFSEVVNNTRRHLLPPPDLWANMVPTLAISHLLRARIVGAGGHGLRINAAHRWHGGSRRSKHKLNAALDLDLLSLDHGMADDWIVIGAGVWRDHAHLKIGMGSYHPQGTQRTRRLHVDTKVRWRRAVWQYSGSKKIRRPAIAEIAGRL